MIHVSLVNKSTVVSDTELIQMAQALQIQVNRDFYPAWGVAAQIYWTPTGGTPTPDHWILGVFDDSTQPGALGYHDITPTAQPIGYVFAKTTINDGNLVSVTASHELLEMLADPDINLSGELDDASGAPSKFYAYETCLTGDTRIPLLDGTQIPISELVGRENFWVYSCSDNGHVRPGKAHSARLTKKDSPIVEVLLDNSQSIKCTPEHKFLMRDGTYREAQNLLPMDSLMPLYRKREPLDKYQKLDYEWVYMPMEDGWTPTHRVSHPRCPQGWVRHHRDFNRFNNNPDNLTVMTWEEHRRIHQEQIMSIVRLPQTRAAQSRNMRLLNESHRGKKRPELCVPRIALSEEARRASGERGREVLVAYNKSAKHRELARIIGREALRKLRLNPDFIRQESERGKERMRRYNGSEKQRADHRRYTESERGKNIASTTAKLNNHTRWHAQRGVVNVNCELCTSATNHKVVSVTPCGVADVYDITVDKYHNFATSSGVFVHNCDPVEADADGYDIQVPANFTGGPATVHVSDFTLPSWFESFNTTGPWDFQKHLKAPFTLNPGGYIGFLDLANLSAGWQQQTARMGMSNQQIAASRPQPGSRRFRRRLPRSEWMRSNYLTDGAGSSRPAGA